MNNQKAVEAEMEKFRVLQGGNDAAMAFLWIQFNVVEMQEIAQRRQQFVQQANENGMVQKVREKKACIMVVYKRTCVL